MGTPGCLELVTLVAGPDSDGPLMTDLPAEHAANLKNLCLQGQRGFPFRLTFLALPGLHCFAYMVLGQESEQPPMG
eukprot:2988948-Amphidinium_carterae.1